MDASISDDPRQGDDEDRASSPAPTVEFPGGRWERAGASGDETAELRASWDAMSPEQQVAEATAVQGVSDNVLGEALVAQIAADALTGYVAYVAATATPVAAATPPQAEASSAPPGVPVDEPATPGGEPEADDQA